MKSLKKKIAAICMSLLAAVCVCLPIAGCVSAPKLSFLTTEGELVKNDKGETVFLRGVNAGGLFVTEHWMTGFAYGSSDSNDYRSLTKTFIERFGEQATLDLWAEYRANWWTEADFKNCADMGMNVIRLPFTYMNVDFDAVIDYEYAGQNYDFSALDDFVKNAAKHGMYTILDLHGAYGSQNGQDHSGEIMDNVADVDFYSNKQMMGLTADLWAALAEHYKDNPNVAGYDILNEPGEKAGSTSKRHWDFYDTVYKAIRETGDNHIVIFESCWNGENLPKPADYGWKNCMYSFHHYAGTELSEQAYNLNWNNKIANVSQQHFGVPVQMGEFTNYSNAHNWEYTLDLLNRSNWHWTSWTYKVWGNMPWGVVNIIGNNRDKVNASTDEYDEILNKFKTLRTDGESAQKYTFNNWVPAGDGSDEYVPEKYRTLEDIFTEYCNGPSYERKVPAGVCQLSYGDKKLEFGANVGGNDVLSVGGQFDSTFNLTFKIEYNSLGDGSANITVDGKYLTVISYGGEDYITLKTSNGGTASRFYPVIDDNGEVALVSYSSCKYLRVGDDGIMRADASIISQAAHFGIRSGDEN